MRDRRDERDRYRDSRDAYDNRDNLIALTDANGNTTRFEYDRNNRLITETRPMGQETVYRYDKAGNLIEKLDVKHQKTGYTYDAAGRMTGIRYYTASDHNNPVKTVTFSYDRVGNLMGYDGGKTSAVYTYDPAYRKVSETVNYGSFSKSFSYTYYKNGFKKSFTAPDGTVYSYAYDANNQLVSVNIPGAGSITVNSYTWNRPAEMTLPGGSTKTFEYDPLMRIKRITARDPGKNAVVDYQYGYDKMDNITAKTTEHGNYFYQYDDLYRLSAVDNPDFDDEGFTYDPVGNRLTSADTTGNWSYNQNNELGSYDNTSFVYDDNGNMTQKNVASVTTSYVYNIEDRLTEVKDGSDNLIASYYYDPFGRRLWKEVSGVRTYFHYSDEGLVAELDSSGQVVKSYGYKPNSTWTTDPLFMKTGSDYYFYQNDHLGTPQKLTAINGAVVWSAKYSSFGKATIDDLSTITNNLRFPGQYFDKETGLHYNFKRYYDPVIGRYLTEDPTRVKGGLNLYEYAKNNPLRFKDSTGESVGVGISGGTGFIGGGGEIKIVECCQGNYKIRYWMVSTKVGVGLIGGLSAGVSYEKNDPDKCPPTGCSPKTPLGIGGGPFGAGYDFWNKTPSAGLSHNYEAGGVFSAGVFLECSAVIRTRNIGCCD